MRIHERRVVPRGRGSELVEVQLTDRHDSVLRLTVDLVAIDVERVGELVVRAVLLELADGRRNDRRVHDANGCRRVGVLAQLPRLGIRRRFEVALLETVDAVRGLRRVDIALVVRTLERLLVGHDLELVHEERVGDGDDERGHDEQRRADEREAPSTDDGRDEEQDRDDRGRDREDRESGDHGVHVHVARTRDAIARGGERLEAVEPKARTLDEEVETGDDRELDTCGLRNPELPLTDPHRPVEVADERRDTEADEEDRGDEAQRGREERDREQVEPDVHLELGVGRAGVHAVRPEPHRLPLRRRGETGEEAEEDRNPPHREAAERLYDFLVVVELRRQACIDGAEPVGELNRREDGEGHREEPHEEHHDPAGPLRDEHAAEAQLIEPQPIGEQAREDEEAHHDDGDDREGDADRAADGTGRGLVRR